MSTIIYKILECSASVVIEFEEQNSTTEWTACSMKPNKTVIISEEKDRNSHTD